MPARLSDKENNELVRRAIDVAEQQATSDAEFAQILRAAYLASHPAVQKPRTRTGVRRSAAAPPPQADDFQIFQDPRFLRNARAMAQRVRQRLRIMGGSKAGAKDFPDCVAVGKAKKNSKSTEWECTGTLVAPNVVVTAGHCADGSHRVFFGSDVKGPGTVIDVDRAVRHPAYSSANDKNDLLVLVLKKKAAVKPRKLATGDLIDAATDGRAVGFGNIDAMGAFGYGTKRMVDVPIASPLCAGKIAGKGTDAVAYGCHRNLELVAGKQLLSMDACSGDSGGPFYVPSGKTWLLAAATSRATTSAVRVCGDGGIYVRLDRYREWIEDVAKVKLP